MIQKFRKKPVIIDAVQFNGNNQIEIMDFVGMKLEHSSPPSHYEHDHDITDDLITITIPTLEDGKNGQVKHIANRHDWIIKGVNGEFYPCKPDIFDKTYELAALEDLRKLKIEKRPYNAGDRYEY